MRIRYFSDFHTEFRSLFDPSIIKPGKDEILILAGDMGQPSLIEYYSLFEYLSQNFKKIFYVPGNHEYYSSTNHFGITQEIIPSTLSKFKNVSVLDCRDEVYEGYHFVGATMWSHVKDHQYKINDVYSIPEMNISLYNDLNREEVEYLTTTIDSPLPEGIKGRIVITHHIPSESLIDPIYKYDNYNQWFFSDMDDVIRRNRDKIVGWWYGHTHMPGENIHLDVRFHCNPVGYPGEDDRKLEEVTNVSVDII